MSEIFRNIAKDYEKECAKCKKMEYVPNGYEICLKCISLERNLKSWETICLQCGDLERGLKDGNKICRNCLRWNEHEASRSFFSTLSDEQRKLFKEYEKWNHALSCLHALEGN